MKALLTLLVLFFYLGGFAQVKFAVQKEKPNVICNDTTFVNITDYSDNFIIDMKYATIDNFLKAKVYDCATCYLRYKTVKKLLEINSIVTKNKIKIKLFDCYRPLDIQKKMWALVSNPAFVANPVVGSIHNRGCAVDLTLVDQYGAELDMGTPFDFFGPAASHQYNKLNATVKKNRLYLKTTMLLNGFASIDSEWWHYNLVNGASEKIANFKWTCD